MTEFKMSWGENDGVGWIEMQVPSGWLTRFSTPGDVLMQFLVALQERGVNIGETNMVRSRIQTGVTVMRWEGVVGAGMAEVMPGMVRELSGE